jgi:hypothetical protein
MRLEVKESSSCSDDAHQNMPSSSPQTDDHVSSCLLSAYLGNLWSLSSQWIDKFGRSLFEELHNITGKHSWLCCWKWICPWESKKEQVSGMFWTFPLQTHFFFPTWHCIKNNITGLETLLFGDALQVLDSLMRLLCRSPAPCAEALWHTGWLLRQLLPYHEQKLREHHVPMLSVSIIVIQMLLILIIPQLKIITELVWISIWH